MNTALLRAARRFSNGTRQWTVPGRSNAVKLMPNHSFLNAPAISWPAVNADGSEVVRTVRLDWHRSIAKAEVRKLLAELSP